jgi:hypothetical protein
MYRLGAWVLGVFVALLIGCSPAKELPDEVPKAAPKSEPPGDPLGKIPEASDPAAKAVVDRAIKAITQGDPSKLVKAKISIAKFVGTFQYPTQGAPLLEANLRWDVVWPDRGCVVYQFKDGLLPNNTFRFLRPLGWLTSGLQDQGGNPTELGRTIFLDIVAQHGVPLGLTLAEPQAVFFDVHKPTEGPPGTAVKIGIRDLPIVELTFDEKTDVPVRVEYHPREANYRAKNVFLMSAHRLEGGLLLPGAEEYSQNGHTLGKWKLESWEFPEKIDEAKFSPPK